MWIPCLLLVVFAGCGDDSPETSCTETATLCTAAGKYQTCSDGKSTWYNWNEKKYPCASHSDCTDAAAELALDILAFCNP